MFSPTVSAAVLVSGGARPLAVTAGAAVLALLTLVVRRVHNTTARHRLTD